MAGVGVKCWRRAFALDGQVRLSAADVQAPWHGVLEQCGSFVMKHSRLDACED